MRTLQERDDEEERGDEEEHWPCASTKRVDVRNLQAARAQFEITPAANSSVRLTAAPTASLGWKRSWRTRKARRRAASLPSRRTPPLLPPSDVRRAFGLAALVTASFAVLGVGGAAVRRASWAASGSRSLFMRRSYEVVATMEHDERSRRGSRSTRTAGSSRATGCTTSRACARWTRRRGGACARRPTRRRSSARASRCSATP